MRNPLDYIPHLIVACIAAMPILLILCGINEAFGTQTVLQTWQGTKSVCARQQYNYSLKHTQCVEYKAVPATCKKTEHDGPVFERFVSSTCE